MEEDPRELARRLAQEAKLRHQKGAAEDPRELARRLAEEAKQRLAGDANAAAPLPPEARAPVLPLSAKEALAKARAKRASQPAAPPPPLQQNAPMPDPMPSDDPVHTFPLDDGLESDLEPTMPIPGSTAVVVSRLITGLLPDATVIVQEPVLQLDVFRALWRAHLARARQEADVPLVALATVLLDGIDRLEPGQLIGCHVIVNNAAWAGWIDLDRGVLLGVAQPVEVYLTGP